MVMSLFGFLAVGNEKQLVGPFEVRIGAITISQASERNAAFNDISSGR